MKKEDEEDVESSEIKRTPTEISIEPSLASSRSSPSKYSSPSRSRRSLTNGTSRIRHLLPAVGKRKGIGKVEWAREIDFPLAGNAVAVGLTNIAHIAFLVYTHGGIAVFVPCLFFMATCAFPLLYMENIIGQSTREGLITMWKILPLAKGVGYSIQIIFITLLMYYLTPATWAVIYLTDALEPSPPWTRCDNLWNSASCEEFNVTKTYTQDFNVMTTVTTTTEITIPPVEVVERHFTSSSSEYLRGRVLRIYRSPYSNPEDFTSAEEKNYKKNGTGNASLHYGFNSKLGIGSPIIDLTLCLVVFYIIIYVFLHKGARWIGYLARVTVPFTILVLFYLLIRGMFISGAWKGVSELMSPKWEVLLEFEVWVLGAIQVFFSLGAGLGSHLTLAAHNKFRQNVWRDSLLIAGGNAFTSLIAVVVMALYIGHCAFIRNLSCLEYFESFQRWDFIFLVMSDSVASIKYGAFGAFLFFTMVAIVILDTTIIMMFILSQAIADDIRFQFPNPRQAAKVIQFALVGFAFIVNIFSLTKGGLWVYQFLDSYAIALPMTVTILFQTVAIGWIWGLKKLNEAAEDMSGRVPSFSLQMCWKYISPICITTVVVFLVLTDSDPTQVEGQTMPYGWHIFGTLLKFSAALCIPGYIVYTLMTKRPEQTNPFRHFLLLFWPQDDHQMLIETEIRNRITCSHLFYSERQLCRRKKVEPSRKPETTAASKNTDNSELAGPVLIKYSIATIASVSGSELSYADTDTESAWQDTAADEFRNEVERFSIGSSSSSFSSISSKSSKTSTQSMKKEQKGGISRKNKLLASRKDNKSPSVLHPPGPVKSVSGTSIKSKSSQISFASKRMKKK